MHPVVIINMPFHGLMSMELKSEITGKKQTRSWLSDQNIFTNSQAYYMIQVSLSALMGFSSSSNRLKINIPLVCKHSSGQALDDARPRQHEQHLQWTPCRAFPCHL